MSKKITGLVYLPLKPEIAKINNLPLKLPILMEDLPYITDKNRIPLDVIVKGLEAHLKMHRDDEYYKSYLIYFYYEKVKKLLTEEKYDEAEAFIEKAGTLKKDYRYHFYKALLYKRKNEFNLAEIEFKTAISMKKDFSLAYYELGKLYFESMELDDAERVLQEAIETSPDFVLPYILLGDVFYKKGIIEKALEHYKKALEIDENLPDVYNRIGVIMNIFQKFKEAEKYFRKALKLFPNYIDAALNLSYSLLKLAKPFEAFEVLSDFSKKYPENVEILNELGIVQRELGLFHESFETLKKAHDIDQENEIIMYNLGRTSLFVDREHAYEILRKIEKDEDLKHMAQNLMDYSNLKSNLSFIKNNDIVKMIEKFYEKDIKKLLEPLKHSIKNEDLKSRTEKVLSGHVELLDTNIDTSELLDAAALYIIAAKDFVEMEERSIIFGVAVYGSGRMLAVLRVILRLLQEIMVNGHVDLQSFKDSIVPEIQDMDWKLAYTIATVEDKIPSMNPKTGSDFVIALLNGVEFNDESLSIYNDLIKIHFRT